MARYDDITKYITVTMTEPEFMDYERLKALKDIQSSPSGLDIINEALKELQDYGGDAGGPYFGETPRLREAMHELTTITGWNFNTKKAIKEREYIQVESVTV